MVLRVKCLRSKVGFCFIKIYSLLRIRDKFRIKYEGAGRLFGGSDVCGEINGCMRLLGSWIGWGYRKNGC